MQCIHRSPLKYYWRRKEQVSLMATYSSRKVVQEEVQTQQRFKKMGFDSWLQTVTVTGTDDYNLLTLLGSEWTTLAENHKHCFGDEEERTFNSKKLNKLLRALVLMWASQVFGYLVWSTVTELCSASKARGIWEKTANANQRCSRHQLIGYKGFLCHWLRLCCTAPKTSLCPRALCPQRIGFRLWCICFCKVREFYHELLHNKPTSSFVPKWGPYSIFYSCIFNM